LLDEKSLQTRAREGARQFCQPEEDLSGRCATAAMGETGAKVRNAGLTAPLPSDRQAGNLAYQPTEDPLPSGSRAASYCDDIPASKWHTMAVRLAIISVAMGAAFPYFMVHWLGGHLNDLFGGPSLDTYMHTSGNASTIGLFLTICGYAGLLRSFANVKTSRPTIFVRWLFIAALLLQSAHANGAVGVFVAAACCLGWLGLMGLGRSIRLALPESFRHKRTVATVGFASLPVALITLTGIYTACNTHHPPGYVSHFADVVAADLPLVMGFMAIVLALPAYAVARCARTSAVKPLVALTLLVHSPLLIGLTLQTVLMTGAGIAWQSILAMIAALFCAVLSLSAGAVLAAATNHHKHTTLMLNNDARPYF
jgi:hypothetical protein